MSFLDMAATVEGGEKTRGYAPKHQDPLVRDKANFRDGIETQIEMIKAGTGKINKSGNQSGNMFEKLPNGSFRVTLKNGISVMKVVPGKEYFDLPTADEAVGFLAKAAVAAEEGEFDEIFKKTARKIKAKDKKGVGANVIDAIKSNGASAEA
jgi:hypothetical protein